MTNALRTLCALALCLALAPFASAQEAASQAGEAGVALTTSVDAQPLPVILPENDVIYSNGPLANSIGSSVPSGGDESVIQGDEGLFGYGAQADPAINNAMADDFFVPAGEKWKIKGAMFYAYQSFAPVPPTTITGGNFTIHAGDPNSPAVCSGTYVTTDATDTYRNNDGPGGNEDRHIQKVTVDFDQTACSLMGPGVFWITMQYLGSAAFSGPWQPPVPQPLGQVGCAPVRGAGAQQSITGGLFAEALNGLCLADLPFMLLGQINGPGQCGLSYVAIAAANSTAESGGGRINVNPNPVTPPAVVSFSGVIFNNTNNVKQASITLSYARVGGPPPPPRSIRFGPAPVQPGPNPFKIRVNVPGAAPPGAYVVILDLKDKTAGGLGEQCDSEEVVVDVLPHSERVSMVEVSDPFVAMTDGFEFITAPEASALTLASASAPVAVMPNPFSGATQIAFATDATSDVRLAVYDVLGREVAVLVDGTLDAGAHRATFNGRDLAAGTYVYRLSLGADVQTGRITLAR